MDWKPLLGLPLWVWLIVFPSLFAILCLMLRQRPKGVLKPLWKILDGIYTTSGVLAACCMTGILLIIIVQMVFRWASLQFPGSTDFAGYAMAAASFFALARALNRGAHIPEVNGFTHPCGCHKYPCRLEPSSLPLRCGITSIGCW